MYIIKHCVGNGAVFLINIYESVSAFLIKSAYE